MNTKNNTLFSEWYNNLPSKYNKIARQLICERCHISQKTFYNWLNGFSRLPEIAKPIINQIAQEMIFPLPEANGTIYTRYEAETTN